MSQINSSSGSAPKPSPAGAKRSLVVGVNGSRFLSALSPLKYPEFDAEGISWLLRQKESGFVPFRQALCGKAASAHEVRRVVNDLIEQSQPDDLLLFYFICHSYALSTNQGAKIYLVTDDFNPRQAEKQPDSYLSLEWIWKTFLDNRDLRNVIVILDCCNASEALDPFSPSDQVLRSLEAFLAHVQQPEQFAETQSTRMWALIASTEANTPAYEGLNPRGEGHVRMTGLILDALKGKAQEALDSDGDLTLHSLHNHLQKRLPELGPQRQIPIMKGTFSYPWVLAQNPVRTDPGSFHPEPDNSAEPPSTPLHQFFDETICQTATTADLNMEQVEAFLQKELVHRQDEYRASLNGFEQMEALGLLRGKHPSYGALLCFGSSPSRQISGAYTRCIVWSGTERRSLSGSLGDNENKNNKEYRGGLLQQFAQAYNFLVQHLGNQVSHGDEPTPGKLYSRVLAEALANALIHRQYVTEADRAPRAEGVMVEIFSDRVEIHSPGASPLDIAILQNASEQHPHSHPRNPQIMRIFYLAGHVDRVGTGIARMQRWMLEAGLAQPNLGLNEQTQTFSIGLDRPTVSSTPKEPPVSEPKNKQETTNQERPRFTHFSRFRQPRCLVLILLSIILIAVLSLGIGAYIISPLWHPSTPTPTPVPAASTTIEIASDFPTSGLDTTSGPPLQNGVQMAIDDANHNQSLPGYTFKLTPYDDVGKDNRHDPQVGANNLRKAVADNLVASAVGPGNSAVARAELPITNQGPLAQVSPNTTYPCLTKNVSVDPDCAGSNDIEAQMRPTGQLTYFRLATTDDVQGKAAADYFLNVQHFLKVLLIKDDSDTYSYGLAQAFQEEWTQLHGQILPLGLPEHTSSIQDYQNTLQAAIPFQPDLIYFSGNNPNGTYVLQALSNIPQLKMVTFAGGDGIMDSDFQQVATRLDRSAPVYVSLPFQDPAHSGTSVGVDFESNYTASGYANYIPASASAYDCTKMLIQAIKTVLQKKEASTPHGAQDQAGAKQFRQAILHELAHETYTGATGTHSFDQYGDTTSHTISFYQLDPSKPQADWTWLQQVNA